MSDTVAQFLNKEAAHLLKAASEGKTPAEALLTKAKERLDRVWEDLGASQKAMFGARILPMFEAEAKKRKWNRQALGANASPWDAKNPNNLRRYQVRRPVSTERVAVLLGVNSSYIRQAKILVTRFPEYAERVEECQFTLRDAFKVLEAEGLAKLPRKAKPKTKPSFWSNFDQKEAKELLSGVMTATWTEELLSHVQAAALKVVRLAFEKARQKDYEALEALPKPRAPRKRGLPKKPAPHINPTIRVALGALLAGEQPDCGVPTKQVMVEMGLVRWDVNCDCDVPILCGHTYPVALTDEGRQKAEVLTR